MFQALKVDKPVAEDLYTAMVRRGEREGGREGGREGEICCVH